MVASFDSALSCERHALLGHLGLEVVHAQHAELVASHRLLEVSDHALDVARVCLGASISVVSLDADAGPEGDGDQAETQQEQTAVSVAGPKGNRAARLRSQTRNR